MILQNLKFQFGQTEGIVGLNYKLKNPQVSEVAAAAAAFLQRFCSFKLFLFDGFPAGCEKS